MAVKIMIKRKFKSESVNDISAMLIKARKNAMTNKGYISTETLVNYDDPCQVVVVSMWQKKEDWDAYVGSPERQENEANFSQLLATDTQYEIYSLGL